MFGANASSFSALSWSVLILLSANVQSEAAAFALAKPLDLQLPVVASSPGCILQNCAVVFDPSHCVCVCTCSERLTRQVPVVILNTKACGEPLVMHPPKHKHIVAGQSSRATAMIFVNRSLCRWNNVKSHFHRRTIMEYFTMISTCLGT